VNHRIAQKNDCPRAICFISLETWDDIWRRNQFIAKQWDETGWSVAFVGPGRDLSYSVRSRDFSQFWGGTQVPENLPLVNASRPLKVAPNSLKAGAWINDRLWCRHLKSRFPKYESDQVIFWVNDHSCTPAIRTLPKRCLIYDITDDWTQFKQPGPAERRTREGDRWLCENADAVVVCSQGLFECKKDLVPNDRLFLIPNGVDIEHYADCVDPQRQLNASSNALVFGYTGSIHGQRVDVDLVASLASRLDRGIIRLVGPDMLTTPERDALLRTGRVEFCGPKPYKELPAVMRKMDVMIVPHLVTPFTESLNPLKLWEYLASGKPIVSTPVAGFRDFPASVRLAGTADSFHAAMMDSLTESSDVAIQRRAAAEGHSWQARAEQIEKVIAFAIANRRV